MTLSIFSHISKKRKSGKMQCGDSKFAGCAAVEIFPMEKAPLPLPHAGRRID